MEKQSETIKEFLKSKGWQEQHFHSYFFPFERMITDISEYIERQKIEAQQVAGMNWEQCLRKVLSEVPFKNTEDAMEYLFDNRDKETVLNIIADTATAYASACVAEKEREIELYKEALTLSQDTVTLYKRIQELSGSQWISVDDRLPEAEQRVIAIGKHNTPVIDYWNNDKNSMGLFQTSGNFKMSYTHWMPLPFHPDKQ